MRKLQLLTIYVGGFIGPFAGQSIAVILPNVAASFDITLEQAAITMSAYLFPFATVMLFSTRLVRSFHPHHVILSAYSVILVGSAICLLASTWWPFLVGFTILGLGNAFTLPVFQVMLRQIIAPEKLGSALGTYAAMQSLGLFTAPLVSGLASLVGWQYLYLIVVASSLWVLIVKVPRVPPPITVEVPVTYRTIWWPTVVHAISCLMIGFGVIGVAILTALHVGDRFDVGSVGRGVVVMCGGLTAFLLARTIGRFADQVGAKKVFLLGTVTAGLALFATPLAPHPSLVAVCWALAIVSVQGMQMCINLVVLRSPGGVSLLSTVQAFRFFGSSLTPVALLPIYLQSANWAFWVPAAAMMGVLVLQATNPSWRYSISQ